ncbi:MAG: hypothetical protein QG608_1783 [Actinomycetota bacterium]|nr:hypothetical protein [Actinomycetota bacterium]
MLRLPSEPRTGWRATVESQGLSFAVDRDQSGTEQIYWNESAYYLFSEEEITTLEQVTERLHGMCWQAVQRMAEDPGLTVRMGLEPEVHELLKASVAQAGAGEDLSLYGRFDLFWDGTGPPKMLEYNADTPAGLVEASVIQWFWLQDVYPHRDQWNMLHERLVQRWGLLEDRMPGRIVHFAVGQNEPTEDWATVAYLRDTAQEAGLTALGITMEELGWHHADRRFVDSHSRPVDVCFKLYPWDWMLQEPFGEHLLPGGAPTRWIEPAWKLLAGSKALLAVLWEMFPGHENLVPAFLDSPRGMERYVSKPVFGWEGAGIEVVTQDGHHRQDAAHTLGQAPVFQEYIDPPNFQGHHPVLGTWMIGPHSAGLGVRESGGPVTDTSGQFVPHVLDTSPATSEQIRQWLDEPVPPTGPPQRGPVG